MKEKYVRDKAHFACRRSKRRLRELQSNYWMGWISAIIVVMLAGVMLLVFSGALHLIFGFMCVCMVCTLLSPEKVGVMTMIKLIKRGLGISSIEGKLGALAQHFGLRFNLIPEHWNCEKVDEG